MKEAGKSDRSKKDKDHRQKTKVTKKYKSSESATRSQDPKHSKAPPETIYEEKSPTLADLPDHLKPVFCFVDDKEKLIDQLFLSMNEFDLSSLIPEHLKCHNLDDLKKMCLEELKLMSKELILHVIQGLDPTTFDSGMDDSEKTSSLKEEKIEFKSEEQVSTSSFPESIRSTLGEKNPIAPEDLPKPDESKKVVCLEFQPSRKEASTGEENEDSDLELLELEMRARAIRSLLRSRGQQPEEEDQSNDSKM